VKILRNISLSNKQRKAILLAAKMAADSPCFHKHGAVLLSGGNTLVNVAKNSYDYCSFGERFNHRNKRRNWYATRHAELAACLNMPPQLTRGGTVFVVRVNNSGEFRNSMPCPMCQAAMRFCNIKKVIFSDESGFSIMKL